MTNKIVLNVLGEKVEGELIGVKTWSDTDLVELELLFPSFEHDTVDCKEKGFRITRLGIVKPSTARIGLSVKRNSKFIKQIKSLFKESKK